MRTPYGLEIIENCLVCPHREERLFCNLPDVSVKAMTAITSSAAYPKGATLFVEGQPARGVFILCSGRVKLSTSSADGKTLILRIAEPGEVLGLPATVTGTAYELTADIIEPAQANFIGRTEFLNFLKEHGEAALRVAQQLGETYHSAIAEMRTIGLSHSASEKLARFLLEWTSNSPEEKRSDTHQDDPDPRRDRSDDWFFPGNRHAPAGGFPPETNPADCRFDFDSSQQGGSRSHRQRLGRQFKRPVISCHFQIADAPDRFAFACSADCDRAFPIIGS